MEFKKIEVGKKYYHTVTAPYGGRSSGTNEKITSTIRVVGIDKAKVQVCASINNGPAMWHPKSVFSRWKETKPEEKQLPGIANAKNKIKNPVTKYFQK